MMNHFTRIGQKLPSGLEGLKIFTTQNKNKNPSQIFAGRRSIISNVEDTCSSNWEYYRAGRPHMFATTRLVHGAPGSGKTSILVHLHHKWAEGSYITKCADGFKRNGPSPVMLFVGSDGVLDSIETFCMNLVELVEPAIGDDTLAKICETIRVIASREASLVQDQTKAEKVKELAAVQIGLSVVKRLLPRNRWKRPVVIGVDDAHNLSGDKFSPFGRLLQSLYYDSLNMPITVVLVGNSESKDRFDKLGLTGLDRRHTHTLNCLDEQEISELKKGFCSQFKIDLRKQESRFDQILAKSNGWPCHIQNSLYAFAEQYIEAKGEIENVDFSLVESQSLDARTQYYYRRMSNELRNSMILLSSVMKKLTEPISSWNVIDIIEQQSKLGKCQVEKLPKDMTAENYYKHLIHRGVLQQEYDFTVDCPVPSFRQFLIGLPS